ncbi:MAG: hypothetical protein FWG72_05900 [Oscillospiraceae bacterium]|nr:hypothetical protein [Oscillospiraceae bacterium]
MSTNHYINLLAQAEKLYRHNRQGSYKTKERYFEAYKRKFGGIDRSWSHAEFSRMIGECWKTGRGDYEACIVIAYYAGLRLHEVMRIEFEKFLRLTSPGHKLFVPQGKQTHIAKTELQNFINKHRKLVQDPGSTKPMTYHGLRHTCAANWYQKMIAEGKTEYEARKQVSQWLGHERDDVTRIYLASIESGNPSDSDGKGGDGNV